MKTLNIVTESDELIAMIPIDDTYDLSKEIVIKDGYKVSIGQDGDDL